MNVKLYTKLVPSPGHDSIKIKHEPELQGGFKALAEKGIRITNYLTIMRSCRAKTPYI